MNPQTFALALLLLAGCTSHTQKFSLKPVLEVNEHVLTAKEFSVKLARRLKDLDALAAKDPSTNQRAKEEILKTFIVQSLTLDWARYQKITLSEDELDKEVDKIRASYPDDLSFRRVLSEEKTSFSDWREQLRYSLIEKAVFKKIGEKTKPPSEAEIKSYYEENKETFKRKERIYLRQIVVDEEAKAELLKAELKKKDFSALAIKYSIAPEAKAGGLVGWIEKGSVDFFDPLFSLPAGGVSVIFKSPFGYHIAKIEKKSSAMTLPLEEVRSRILQTLMAMKEQAEFVSWLDLQLRSAKVHRDNDLINAIRVDTRGDND
ncbi:MAG: peptidyl-prolyl cis-trans isomerase [Bdellovibrionota bacterium]